MGHPIEASGLVRRFGDLTAVDGVDLEVADGEIFYEFSVDDPAVYSSPWRAELSFYATKERVYEYACHEGNHAMEGILGGARRLEREKSASAGMTVRR